MPVTPVAAETAAAMEIQTAADSETSEADSMDDDYEETPRELTTIHSNCCPASTTAP